MQHWLQARATISPQRTAFYWQGQAISYAEFYAYSQNIAYQLSQKPNFIQPGAHIAVIADTAPTTVYTLGALMLIGAVIVPINTRLTSTERRFQVQQADCKLALCDEAYCDEQLPCPTCLIQPPDDHHHFESSEIDLEAPFAIIHTSGTSGQPKGARLTYGNIFYSAMSSAYRIGHQPDDCWLCVLPLYHVGGLSILVRAILYGITVDLHARFDVETVNERLTSGQITLASLVPTMLYRLLETRRAPWSDQVRLILLGGAAANEQLIARCIAENIPVATTYGLSEASSQVATTLPGEAVHKPGTVGKPLMLTQVRIVDETGQPVEAGIYGEVIVKGLTVMHDYYNNPEATAKTIRDGWLYTGDIGYLDVDGDLWLVQRRSDLIVSGGENVYPAEVEAVLRQHPAVLDAVVIGLDDAEWGQRVAAAIILRPSMHLEIEAIISFVRQQLAGYKIPRSIQFVDAFPMTANGKIQRSALRTLFNA